MLEGVRVVECVAFVAAPLAGMTLAQMGADVIRIDPIGGGPDMHRWPVSADGTSLYWAGLNKGKRSVALDLRRPEGRAIAHALITGGGASGGVFVTNLAARNELSYPGLCATRADMIMASLAGSHDGSIAVDYTVNAITGLPAMTGPAGQEQPVNHVLPIWDVAAGLSLVSGIIAALRWRERTGAGQQVDLALADMALATMSHLGFLADSETTGVDRPRFGNHVYGTFGRDFGTADGRRVMVVVVTDRQWRALGEATGLTARFAQLEQALGLDLRREGDRHAARESIALLIEPWVAARDLAAVAAAFEAAGVLWGPYRTLTQTLAEDARCSLGNPLFTRLDQPGIGPHLAAGSAVRFGVRAQARAVRAPRLGEHTAEVLGERLGYGAERVAELVAGGIIAT